MSSPEKFFSVFARNCEVRRIGKAEADAFLSASHRFGTCAAKYRYGIFVSRYSGAELAEGASHPYPVGTLVAVASFSNARRWIKPLPGTDSADTAPVRSYEWLRYASLPEIRVIGGMGKALQAFIDEVHPDDVMSYAPLIGSPDAGEVYETLGFVREGVKTFTAPDGTMSQSVKYRQRFY